MRLRLLITEECNRNCVGCCNKQWDLKALPVEWDFTKYSEIILTGGEPMLKPEHLHIVINYIQQETKAPIYLYTAKVDDAQVAMETLNQIDGITVTLHSQNDVLNFQHFHKLLWTNGWQLNKKSLRLNIFKGVKLIKYQKQILKMWKIKDNIEWIKDCPLPEGEVFKRFSL